MLSHLPDGILAELAPDGDVAFHVPDGISLALLWGLGNSLRLAREQNMRDVMNAITLAMIVLFSELTDLGMSM